MFRVGSGAKKLLLLKSLHTACLRCPQGFLDQILALVKQYKMQIQRGIIQSWAKTLILIEDIKYLKRLNINNQS